jgi:hypothetical protein
VIEAMHCTEPLVGEEGGRYCVGSGVSPEFMYYLPVPPVACHAVVKRQYRRRDVT